MKIPISRLTILFLSFVSVPQCCQKQMYPRAELPEAAVKTPTTRAADLMYVTLASRRNSMADMREVSDDHNVYTYVGEASKLRAAAKAFGVPIAKDDAILYCGSIGNLSDNLFLIVTRPTFRPEGGFICQPFESYVLAKSGKPSISVTYKSPEFDPKTNLSDEIGVEIFRGYRDVQDDSKIICPIRVGVVRGNIVVKVLENRSVDISIVAK